VHAFFGENANNGLQTGAFYAYPNPKDDKAYMILKGKYKVNETEMKDVSYQIPFMQQGANGNATWFDIANNHRYTVNITKADAYHLDANIKVADWADDGSFEYTPENGSGDFEVTIPESFKDDSKYDKESNTVTMSLKADSEFDLTVSTSSSLTWKKTYVGGLAAQQYDWLEIEEAPTNPISKTSQINYTYTFKPKAGYDKTRFPRAVIRFTNGMDGSETVLFVEPVITAPQFIETKQEDDNRNTYDAEAKTISMYRVLDSKVKVKVSCPHGIHIASQPDWLDVTAIETDLPFTTYEISLKANSRDTEVIDNKGTITFQNEQEAEQQNTVTITLLDASIAADFTNLGGTENTYDEPDGETPGNVNMKLLKDNAFTISTTSLDGVTIETDFKEGPEWFTHNVTPFSRSGNNIETLVFTLNVDALSEGKAKKTTVTLHNVSKGIDKVFTVTPSGYEIINIEQTSSTGNNLINETINMVKMSSTPAYHAQITLEVTSPGGSRVSVSGAGLAISGETSSTAYTTSYILEAGYDAGESGTLTITNYLEPSNSKELTVSVKDQTVTYTSKSTGQTYPALEMTSYWVAPVTEGLANYNDAPTKCPDGWKLPTVYDARNFVRNDQAGLANIFLPGADPNGVGIGGLAKGYVAYWTNSAVGGWIHCSISIDSSEWYWYGAGKPNAGFGADPNSTLNVRCIKDK